MDDASYILSLNTNAVNALICSGNNYGEAALLLREALRLIEMPDEESPFPCTTQDEHTTHKSLLAIFPVHLSQQSDHQTSPSSPSYLHGDQSSFVIYDRAFLIVPQVNLKYDSNKAVMPLSQEQRMRISTVLLFNLALCFHLQGMKNAKVRDRCFREASTFYLMSYGLLEPTSSPLQADILLQLALLNNRGAICDCFQDTQEAQQCLDDLRFALDDLMDNCNYHGVDLSSSSSYSNAISSEDCVLFFKSILYNGRLDARAAPMA
jgi:hypothetical protein